MPVLLPLHGPDIFSKFQQARKNIFASCPCPWSSSFVLEKELNGTPNRVSWIIRCPVMLWFIGQKECLWCFGLLGKKSAINFVYLKQTLPYCIISLLYWVYECTSFVMLYFIDPSLFWFVALFFVSSDFFSSSCMQCYSGIWMYTWLLVSFLNAQHITTSILPPLLPRFDMVLLSS
jgi:hypothetical protein